MTNLPFVQLEAVSYRYPDGTVGLSDCSLSIERGSRTTLMGGNGAGKTTLFMHLNGIFFPKSGRILLNGEPCDYRLSGLMKLRSRVGLVFQNPDSQLFSATVREDVSFGPMNLGLTREEVERRVELALEATGITSIADRPVYSLSFGQKKRACIAGVLAMEPELLVLDEVMSGLDRKMRTELVELLDKLHAGGMTILLSTHDIDFAYAWADRIHLLENGACTASWDTASLPDVTEQLETSGVGVPDAIRLQRLLANRGVIQPFPALRSVGGIIDRVA